MVTVLWKHSPSQKDWFGVSGPSTQGFVVLNRPPRTRLKKLPIASTMPVLCCCMSRYSREVPQRTASCEDVGSP